MRHQEEFASFYEASKDVCLRSVVAAGTDGAVAEEAVAEAFARAWASWSRVRKHPAPRAWVVRTALNYRVSRWRKTRHEVELTTTSQPQQRAVDPQPSGRADLMLALEQLPQRQREVVVLRLFLDLDTQQTADTLGIASGTVTAHLHRAMTTLRAHPISIGESWQ
jgi:RNA polymerase sigma-70 factor (ECF subfamily)